MENFEYSIQLSEQDWAEFAAAAEECGLLQAGLASGDELLSSDTDQRDSSGSSPPGPPPLPEGQLAPRGSDWPGSEEEDEAATRQLVNRSWREPVLAPEAGQQMPSMSVRSEARPSLSPGAAPLVQGSSLLGPVSSRGERQRLLQGPAPRGLAPTPTGEPARSPDSPGRSAAPQRPPGSPGALLRSPSRKKRRAAGTKAGGRLGDPGPAPTQLGSLLLPEAGAEDGLGLAGSRGKGLRVGTTGQTAGAGQIELGPESPEAPEQVARQGPGVDLSTSVPTTEQGTDPSGMTLRTEPRTMSTLDLEASLDVTTAKSDVALSTPTSEPQPEEPLSTPASKPRLDVDLLTPGPVVQLEVDSSTPVSKAIPRTALPHLVPEAGPDVGVSTPAPVPEAGPDRVELELAPVAKLGSSPIRSPEGGRQKPRAEPSAGAPGHHTGEPPPGPIQAPKKKKVRFSMAVPSPEEPGSGEASGPAFPATAPRTAAGGRRASGAWDAVAVGPRTPQPRILKHLPPPAPSASAGPGPSCCFAVTLPEAYEFFFCDTIEEEEEDVEEEAEASQALAEVQWPDVCEFFFQDGQAQRSRHREGHAQAPPLQAEPLPAPPPGEPIPISIPEAYEHFLREDTSGGTLGPAALLQMQATEPPRSVPGEVGTGTPPGPSPASAEQLTPAIRQAGPDNSSACPQPVAGRCWGSSSSGHTACQSRLKFPLEDILQTRKRCPTRTRPSQPDSTMPHATLCLGTKVSRGGCDSGQTCLRTDMARRDMSQGRCV
ncbi:PGC-1 and ERR-induced regulator in muscle protein 1 isoform X1 [Balaenoptera acutorostrata]|uniref:PGC-1 and ERR-induced regulator in muscle protein 1 isoform X1 n=1 Tax=Balaenoptera acutorostrata TaxID=9767 RepID=A0A383YU77_BALAC|nr:PGC-1 and ERR-induced regulator in muscle protein 1 isoform X1 [Balaenoptera acutorostrata]XP_007166337.2 PGC-1 and ERR-induced regulator in muscle protein 1 isoform X1 [Balaenoptera acutorostrata]XP_007166338.2 PGC-1 and ERR-induced regulator in muscle protein 1 isoform X1 [Balaenoptera acutorostrata]